MDAGEHDVGGHPKFRKQTSSQTLTTIFPALTATVPENITHETLCIPPAEELRDRHVVADGVDNIREYYQ